MGREAMPEAAATALAAVQATGLLDPPKPLVVLLSGGRDSVCLLDACRRIAGEDAVCALHVDYGLRAESADDAAHCAALCERLGVELALHRAAPPPAAGNRQDWARTVRYGVANSIAAERDARVAAGHTASDVVETVLYRLAASPGRRALRAMASRDGRLVRPLLELTREQTTAYCESLGLGWRDDATNATDLYARGRVREAVVPALRSVHPAAERNVLRTAQLLAEEGEVLDSVVSDVLDGEPGSIAVERLAALPPALRRLVLRRLAEDVAGRLAPEAATRADELLALARRPGDGELHLPRGLRAVAQGGRLRFACGPPPG